MELYRRWILQQEQILRVAVLGMGDQIQSLGWEDPLETEMATHSSILGLENPMDGEAW